MSSQVWYNEVLTHQHGPHYFEAYLVNSTLSGVEQADWNSPIQWKRLSKVRFRVRFLGIKTSGFPQVEKTIRSTL